MEIIEWGMAESDEISVVRYPHPVRMYLAWIDYTCLFLTFLREKPPAQPCANYVGVRQGLSGLEKYGRKRH
jgi:hypothetical protein